MTTPDKRSVDRVAERLAFAEGELVTAQRLAYRITTTNPQAHRYQETVVVSIERALGGVHRAQQGLRDVEGI